MSKLEELDLRALASAFSLGDYVDSQRIWAGTVNTNYHLETSAGDFFLRINEGKEEEDVEYEVAVLEFFTRHSVNTPLPRLSRTNNRYYKYQGLFISVFDWQEGKQVSSQTIESEHCHSLGLEMGKLHACSPIPVPLQRPSRYSDAELRTRFESFSQSSDPALQGAIAAIAEEFVYLNSVAATREGLAETLIHGDLFPDNVIVSESGLVLLDFEQACFGYAVYDLAVTINAWCFAADFRQERVLSLMKGYQLTSSELVSSQQLLIELRASALRFLVTRIGDVFLNPMSTKSALESKDFRRFLLRLEHWRTEAHPWIDEMAQQSHQA